VSLLGATLVLTHPDLTLALTARYIGITLIARGSLLIGRSLIHRHQGMTTLLGISPVLQSQVVIWARFPRDLMRSAAVGRSR
jgi:uncharacterized membrane protein HdeD (DUF308 family)